MTDHGPRARSVADEEVGRLIMRLEYDSRKGVGTPLANHSSEFRLEPESDPDRLKPELQRGERSH